MSFTVTLLPAAIADLKAIYDYLSDQAGPAIAKRYIADIHVRCASLSEFPRRGTPRGDLGEGLRTIPFRRRVIIAYSVDGEDVFVERILHAKRDLGAAFD
ncbi:hypothetical protein IP88_04720 [alpha proteobacterium AAP81b]|nr:hypothetical protein IP88_04720 [alpha proteobacterium AAP81b]